MHHDMVNVDADIEGRHAHETQRPSGAELDRNPGDGLVVGRLDHSDEVVQTQDGVLGDDLNSEALDLFVNLLDTLRALLNGLAPFVRQCAKQNVSSQMLLPDNQSPPILPRRSPRCQTGRLRTVGHGAPKPLNYRV